MRVRLESTSCETSLIILAFSLGESVVNHFARRFKEKFHLSLASNRRVGDEMHTTLPCLDKRMR